MFGKLRAQTLAFLLACLISGLYCGAALLFAAELFLPRMRVNEGLLVAPLGLMILGLACAVLIPLTLGVYRKNRVALGLSVVIFPILANSAGPGEWASKHPALSGLKVGTSVLVTVAVAGVYARELRRNLRR